VILEDFSGGCLSLDYTDFADLTFCDFGGILAEVVLEH
jgi:hypothetical protein